MYQFPQYQLAVFTKSPILGAAKTRLQPQYPVAFSLSLHIRLVDYVLMHWTQSAVCPETIWLAGDSSEFKKHLPQWQSLTSYRQQGQHLGERMQFAVEQVLNTSDVDGILLVGTDCPFISADYLKQACDALQQHDVVIGPATDGGYVLLGLKACHGALFEGIAWGTDSVYLETLKKIKQLDLTYAVLPEMNDIDRPEDLALLKKVPFFSDLFS